MQYLSFCVWLISLNVFKVHPYCSMHQYFLFLRMNNIPSFVCYIFYLSIHPLMDIWVVSTFWLLCRMLLWTLVYKYLFKSLLSLLLSIYPEVELWDQMALLCLMFRGNSRPFSRAATSFYIPISSKKGLQFLHIPAILLVSSIPSFFPSFLPSFLSLSFVSFFFK